MMNLLKVLLGSVVWNSAFNASPAGSDDVGQGDDKIVELKEAIYERLVKEHTMDESSGAVAEDGAHRAGSAVVYTGTSEPTTKPDGVTALDADDNGRLFVNTSSNKVYSYRHGTGWVLVGIDEPPIGAVYVQFASQSTPATLYGGTWSNVSSSYAGLFFRAEGGNAAAFEGGTQAGTTVTASYLSTVGVVSQTIVSASNYDAYSGTSTGTVRLATSSSTYSSPDVYSYLIRPVNQSIRIWKRTA